MKNLYKFLGIITIVAVIGFSVVGCSADDGGGSNNSSGNSSGNNDNGGNNSGGNNSGGNDSGGNNSGGNNNSGGTKPSAPTGVKAYAIGAHSITVEWNAVSDATSYKVYYTDMDSGYITSNLAGTTSSSPYTHTGLKAGTTYSYNVAAVNSAGESMSTVLITAKTFSSE